MMSFKPSRTTLLAGVLALTVGAYLQSVTHQLVLDDHDLFQRVLSAFHSPIDAWKTGNAFQSYYRPVFLTSLYIDSLLFGDNPAGYHVVNLILHLVATWCAFRFAERLFRHAGWAAAATALFALHPAHTENVSWISGRTDVLSAIFIFLALRQFIDLRNIPSNRGAWLTGLWFFLSLASKEIGIVVPVMCAVLALLPLEAAAQQPAVVQQKRAGKGARRRQEKEQAKPRVASPVALTFGLFAAGVALFITLRAIVSKDLLTEDVFTTTSLKSLHAARSLAMYLWHAVCGRGYEYIILGWRSKPAYALHLPESTTTWVLIGSTVVVFAALLVLSMRAKRWIAAVGLSGFALFLIPVLGFVPIVSFFSIRFLYVPSLFLALAAVDGLRALTERFPGAAMVRVAFASVVMASLWFGVETFRQDAHWNDDVTLLLPMKAAAFDSPVYFFCLGNGYRYRGEFMEAANNFSRAVARYPDYYEAHLNLGASYMIVGQSHPEYYQNAVDAYSHASDMFPKDVRFYLLLGDAFLRKGDSLMARQNYGVAYGADRNCGARERLSAMGITLQ